MTWLLRNEKPVLTPDEAHRCTPPMKPGKDGEVIYRDPEPDGRIGDVWQCDYAFEHGATCDEIWEITHGILGTNRWRLVEGLFHHWIVRRRIEKAKERARNDQ